MLLLSYFSSALGAPFQSSIHWHCKATSKVSGIKRRRFCKTAEKLGLTEGETKKQNEIAKNLKAQGVSFDVIVAATGLSKEEIEKL